jgi:hypothetical protein
MMITGARGVRKYAFCLAIFADTPLLQHFGVCAEVDKHSAGCILASEYSRAITNMKLTSAEKFTIVSTLFVVSLLVFFQVQAQSLSVINPIEGGVRLPVLNLDMSDQDTISSVYRLQELRNYNLNKLHEIVQDE